MSADAATRVILLIVAALPIPELRAGAFLAVLTRTVTARTTPIFTQDGDSAVRAIPTFTPGRRATTCSHLSEA